MRQMRANHASAACFFLLITILNLTRQARCNKNDSGHGNGHDNDNQRVCVCVCVCVRGWTGYHAVVNLEDNTVAIAGQPSPNILGFDGGVKKKQNQKDSPATAADAPAPAPAAAAAAAAGFSTAAAGGVTEADFLSMYASHGLNLKEQRAMFDRYDLDKDGVLNPHEMGFVKLRLGEV